MLNRHHCLMGGHGIGAQKAREEALWFGSKLVALLLSVHSSPNNDTSTLVEISAKTRRAGVGTWCKLGFILG